MLHVRLTTQAMSRRERLHRPPLLLVAGDGAAVGSIAELGGERQRSVLVVFPSFGRQSVVLDVLDGVQQPNGCGRIEV